MKSRLTSLDIHCIVRELAAKLANVRLQNIYDYGGQKSYVFKFSAADFKLYLLVESGTRLYETDACQQEDSRALPSGFVVKLRKHLKNRILSGIRQIGFDRIVELEFAGFEAENVLYLYLEFFSLGNIILTDSRRKVMALHRVVNVESATLRVGDAYELQHVLELAYPEPQKLKALLTETPFLNALKKCLPNLPPHAHQFILSQSNGCVASVMKNAAVLVEKINSGTLEFSPVLLCREGKYTDFYCLGSESGNEFSKVGSVNAAANLFFGQKEAAEIALKEDRLKKEAESKIKAIEEEQRGRISSIDAGTSNLLMDARAVEENTKQVDDACLVVRTCLENEMTWDEVKELVEEEKRNSRPTALLIQSLKLSSDMICLKLPSELGVRSVDVNIFMSAHANATRIYDQRKALMDKLARTQSSYDDAIRSAKEKIRRVLLEHKTKEHRIRLQKSRKTFWFEKFAWFITSDNYLVLGGKDAQQNEILVKRYLRSQDIYVHAEISGAASVVVRNHLEFPIPQQSLAEAGYLAICMSRAWDAKIVVGAWWVKADQISKTAPSGEYLGTGSFMVRGQKNFLPPAQLQLGFGFLVHSDDPEALSKRREKRLAMEQMHREAFAEGRLASKDEELSLKIKKYEDSMELTGISELSLVDSEAKVVQKRRNKEDSVSEKGPKEDPKKKSNPQKRGKKGKMKKIKEKYADQDEEERMDRIALLGSSGQDKDKGKVSKSILPQKAGATAHHPAHVARARAARPQVPNDVVDAIECPEEPTVVDQVNFLDSLVQTEITQMGAVSQVVPVCGPWSAIKGYSYRVKLVPGGQKKGKLAQSAVHIISQSSPEAIRNAIKGVPDTDLVQCVFVKSASLSSLTTFETSLLKKPKNKKK